MTFDAGQTLLALDHELLARRVAERGAVLDAGRAAQATPEAWRAYGRAKARGAEGAEAWMSFMRALLERSGVEAARLPALVSWLFEQQPERNLWRRPVPGMFELARELAGRGIPVGVLSNSEGRLEALIEELGRREPFACVVDSGRLGFEKPDRRIFELTAERLGVTPDALVHVGDSWEADVRGALGVGARAIWFDAESDALPGEAPEAQVRRARDAGEVRDALRAWALL
ncbi:MAG: HAD-IA family hydrolase [Sorangiineae bacterium]|nr:HAD-IA family hydrolase [Polyangiaceae bacterium]MEB2321851.1 HAD-IA family hydrolase [Sorangiineae bacterium]